MFIHPAAEDDESRGNLYLSYYQPSTRVAEYAVSKPGDYQIIVRIEPKSFSSFRGFDYNRCRFRFLVNGEVLLEKEFDYTYGRVHEYVFDLSWKPGNQSLQFDVEPLTPGEEQVKRLKMEVKSLTIRGPFGKENWIRPEGYERFFPGGVPETLAQQKRYAKNQ